MYCEHWDFLSQEWIYYSAEPGWARYESCLHMQGSRKSLTWFNWIMPAHPLAWAASQVAVYARRMLYWHLTKGWVNKVLKWPWLWRALLTDSLSDALLSFQPCTKWNVRAPLHHASVWTDTWLSSKCTSGVMSLVLTMRRLQEKADHSFHAHVTMVF